MDPLEEYHSPFDFEQGVNSRYLYLSPTYNDTPPCSPAVKARGSQEHSDSVPEVGEDAVSSVSSPTPPTALSEEERQELQEELVKVEEEIQTLSQVLAAKERLLADIKRRLGITPLNELKQNITKTWQDVTTSVAYRRTSETLSQASLKATAAFSNVGSAISRKLTLLLSNFSSFTPSFPACVQTRKYLKPKSALTFPSLLVLLGGLLTSKQLLQLFICDAVCFVSNRCYFTPLAGSLI